MSDVALTWLTFSIWLVLTALLFIVLARWSAGEGAWGGMVGIVRGLHDWATESRPRARHSSSPAGGSSPGFDAPRAEIEDL